MGIDDFKTEEGQRYNSQKYKSNEEQDKKEKYKDEEWLKKEYKKKFRPAPDIADECRVDGSTIYYYLDKYGIERHNKKKSDVWQKLNDSEWLKHQYIDKELSSVQIANKLGIESHTMILEQLEKINIKRRNHSEAAVVSDHNTTKIDLSKTPNLSYILGVIEGDGSVYIASEKYNNDYQVSLGVTDKPFANSFATAINDIGINPKTRIRESDKEEHSEIYEVTGNSKKLYNWYMNLDGSDKLEIISMSDEHRKEYIRGFYESEGSLVLKGNGVALFMSNTDYSVIEIVHNACKGLGYEFNMYNYKKDKNKWSDLYLLSLSKEDEIRSFTQEINPVIDRKIYE